jgi:hypothetical protein
MKAMKNEFDGDFEELIGELIIAAGVGETDLVQNLIQAFIPELNNGSLIL